MALALLLVTMPGVSAAPPPGRFLAGPTIAGPQAFLPAIQTFVPRVLNNVGAGSPTVSCFYADAPSVAPGGTTNLHWCISGNGLICVTISPTIGVVSPGSTSTPVQPGWTTLYSLVATNPAGSTFDYLTVAVTGGAPCGNIGTAAAWHSSIFFSYDKLGQGLNETVAMHRSGNVSVSLQKSGNGVGGVSYEGYANGSLVIHDHDELSGMPPQLTTVDGSGNPEISTLNPNWSLVKLNIYYDSCTWGLTFNPIVQATQTDSTGSSPIDASVGQIVMGRWGIGFPLNYLDRVGFLNAHSTFWDSTPDSLTDGFIYFPGYPIPFPGGPFPSEDSLGAAYVATSISPVYP